LSVEHTKAFNYFISELKKSYKNGLSVDDAYESAKASYDSRIYTLKEKGLIGK
jgi:hypothetical protein